MSQSLKLKTEEFGGSTPVIIQCPKCQTKFSVESELLDAASSPKFHCSRCDEIFSQDDKPKAATKVAPFSSSIAAELEEPVLESESSEGHQTIQVRTQRPNLQSLRSSRQLEIPKHIDSSFRAQAPLEGAQMSLFAGLGIEELEVGNLGHVSSSATRAPSMSGRTPASAFGQSPSRPVAAHSLAQEGTIHIDNMGPIRHTPLTDDPLPAISREKMKIATQPTAVTAQPIELKTFGWKGVALPLTGFFGFLLCLSAYTFVDVSFGERLKNYLLPVAPSKAPTELFIRSAKIKKVTLDNGDTIQLITGALVNRSEAPVRDVKIEGTLFSDLGKSVGETRIDSGANLAKAKIKSMTPEMIMENQSSKSSKRGVIQPGESREFAMAFFGKSTRAARHFAIRVYSARSI